MSLSRRGFLTGMLALGAAPAIVRAASLMKVVTPAGLIWSGVDLARGEDYHIIMHPSMEQAMRELAFSGTTQIIYKREVLRHG